MKSVLPYRVPGGGVLPWRFSYSRSTSWDVLLKASYEVSWCHMSCLVIPCAPASILTCLGSFKNICLKRFLVDFWCSHLRRVLHTPLSLCKRECPQVVIVDILLFNLDFPVIMLSHLTTSYTCEYFLRVRVVTFTLKMDAWGEHQIPCHAHILKVLWLVGLIYE